MEFPGLGISPIVAEGAKAAIKDAFPIRTAAVTKAMAPGAQPDTIDQSLEATRRAQLATYPVDAFCARAIAAELDGLGIGKWGGGRARERGEAMMDYAGVWTAAGVLGRARLQKIRANRSKPHL